MLTSFILSLALGVQGAASPLPEALALQVALDRAGFSPGVIDGQMGENTRRAAEAYRRQHGKDAEPVANALLTYTITAQDVSGPFAEAIPAELPEQAKLPALAYESPLEALAERFHTSPSLLERLNPGARFGEGEQIKVPDVDPFVVPAPASETASEKDKATGTSGRAPAKGAAADAETPSKPDVVVTVSRETSAVTVHDENQRIVFHAPVTTGSEHDPLPLGEWKVNGVQYSPKFHYNPDLFWNADPSHAKATLPDGPNNPVGVVWIDLSKEHYGLHGTPEPSSVGKTASHGCVRLTNWDALRLAGLVKPGTRVIFKE
jgi:lipoprotein-anchoring transpeptidase ErfK/SrfK